MGFLRILSRHHFHEFLNLNNPPQFLTNPIHSVTPSLIFSISHESSTIPSLFRRYASVSAQSELRIDTDLVDSSDEAAKDKKAKKPLNLLFKEAVGLSEKLGHSESDGEIESGNEELKRKLRKLEMEVKNLTESKRRIIKENPKKEINKNDEDSNDSSEKPKRLYSFFTKNAAADGDKRDTGADDSKKPKRLYNLFTKSAVAAAAADKSAVAAADDKRESGKESKRVEKAIVYKELSSDMVYFANHLYKQGYFKYANFLPRNNFDVTCFEKKYARNFLKYAAEKFGKDNREIAKWLSGNDLKTVASFGCPSLSRKNVFSAKTLRTFFKIQEDTVCSKCVLKPLCKFANQSIWKGNTKTLDLAVVMRVISLYALEAVPSELVVPDEVKASVSRLLKEILHLSETVP